jgi:DNA-directed RNA polymerase subunit RPC12/RpoP
MSASTFNKINSKTSCSHCGHKKLVTNDSEALDDVVHYRCYNCGFEFSENDMQRKYRKGITSISDDESLWSAGLLVLIAMLVTISVLHLERRSSVQSAQYFRQPMQVEVPVLEHQYFDSQIAIVTCCRKQHHRFTFSKETHHGR